MPLQSVAINAPRLNILAVTPLYLPFMGGIEVLVDSLAAVLRGRSIETVVVSDMSGALPAFAEINDTPVFRFPLARAILSGKPEQALGVARQFSELVAKIRPDIIHLHSTTQASAFYVDRLLSRGNPIPLMVTQHGVLEPADQLAVTRRLLLKASVLTGVSDAVLASAVDFSGRDTRSVRIYNGISSSPARNRTFPAAPHRLLGVGRLQKEKGFDLAIEAVALLRAAGLSVTMKIIGEGEERPSLEQQIRSRNLRDYVDLCGPLTHEDTLDQIANASAVLVPSRTREGFSLVAAEAAMLGTPCIAARVGGLPETVLDGISGYIVSRDSVEELAAAATELLQRPSLWNTMSLAGKAHARENFDLEVCASHYEDLYRSLSMDLES